MERCKIYRENESLSHILGECKVTKDKIPIEKFLREERKELKLIKKIVKLRGDDRKKIEKKID